MPAKRPTRQTCSAARPRNRTNPKASIISNTGQERGAGPWPNPSTPVGKAVPEMSARKRSPKPAKPSSTRPLQF